MLTAQYRPDVLSTWNCRHPANRDKNSVLWEDGNAPDYRNEYCVPGIPRDGAFHAPYLYYYQAETTTGRRYWLFRDLGEGAWFLHGTFE